MTDFLFPEVSWVQWSHWETYVGRRSQTCQETQTEGHRWPGLWSAPGWWQDEHNPLKTEERRRERDIGSLSDEVHTEDTVVQMSECVQTTDLQSEWWARNCGQNRRDLKWRRSSQREGAQEKGAKEAQWTGRQDGCIWDRQERQHSNYNNDRRSQKFSKHKITKRTEGHVTFTLHPWPLLPLHSETQGQSQTRRPQHHCTSYWTVLPVFGRDIAGLLQLPLLANPPRLPPLVIGTVSHVEDVTKVKVQGLWKATTVPLLVVVEQCPETSRGLHITNAVIIV